MDQPTPNPVAEQAEEVKTAHTKTIVHHLPGCRLKLEVQVDSEAVQGAWAKALKNVSKEISLPGFRKGKAPDALILKKYGSHVTREWHDVIANTAFQEFLQKTNSFPFTKDKSVKRVEVKNASREDGATVLIEYETGPKIPHVDKSVIKIEPFTRRTISAKEVEDQIHNLQLDRADWSLVLDRPVEEGDFVDLDIVAIDEHPPRPICEEMRFEVAQGKMGTWMRNLIIGKKALETVEGVSEKEESDSSQTEFKPTHCRITIKAIYTSKLPDLDDAFAQKFNLKTMGELKERVEHDLNRRADAEVQDRHRAQVEEQLLAHYQFDLPASMIDAQKRQMVATRLNHLQRSGNVSLPVEQLRQEIDHEVTQELNRAYRLFFLCRSVADAQKIEVFPNEIYEEMGRQMMLAPGQADIAAMQSEEGQSKLYVNVLSRKALDFLAS